MKTHPILNKDVGIATAIGAGFGLIAGGKDQQLISSALFGAGVGALVGWAGAKFSARSETSIDTSDEAKREDDEK